MSEADPTMTPQPENHDDLRQIKGIGQTIAQALFSAGIRRYSDLAGCNPDSLAELLRAKVAFISAQRIIRDNWIGQAKDLADQQKEVDPPDPPGEMDLDPEKDDPDEGDCENHGTGPGHESWKELADFFVSFGKKIDANGEERVKTRVHYSQADRDQEFDGIASDELMYWILQQANLSPSLPAPEQPHEALTPEEDIPTGNEKSEDLSLSMPEGDNDSIRPMISNLWVSVIQAAESFQAFGPQRMVRVEANVDIPGMDQAMLTSFSQALGVDIVLINTETNEKAIIETSEVLLAPETLPYQFQHDLPIPQPARYQLFLVARMAAPSNAFSMQKGPIIRVEG